MGYCASTHVLFVSCADRLIVLQYPQAQPAQHTAQHKAAAQPTRAQGRQFFCLTLPCAELVDQVGPNHKVQPYTFNLVGIAHLEGGSL